jgi:hypothetical protein
MGRLPASLPVNLNATRVINTLDLKELPYDEEDSLKAFLEKDVKLYKILET